MSIKEFDQSKTYEWVGTFWFPDDINKTYAGKLTYTPEQGIRLNLSTPPVTMDFTQDHKSKKIMHAVVDGKERAHLTLINVFLSHSMTRGNPSIDVLKGSVRYIIAKEHLDTHEFDKIAVEYDDHLSQALRFSVDDAKQIILLAKGSSIKTKSDYEIVPDFQSTGTTFSSIEDVDSAFWATNDDAIKDLKKAIEPIREKHKDSLFLRTRIVQRFAFRRKDTSLDDFVQTEQHWRAFWELIIDHPISVTHSWAYVTYESTDAKPRLVGLPLLSSYFKPKKENHKPRHLPSLPLRMGHLTDGKTDLGQASIIINNWLDINDDPKWQPVLDGLKRAISASDEMIDGSQFVSLRSEIETFLDLIGESQATPDQLIKVYASDTWISEFEILTENKPKKETFGQWISHLRDSITHPKTAQKIGKRKYWAEVSDEFKLQKIYAYVSGLLIKAILLHIGIKDHDAIEKFIDQFIKSRASFFPIEFE